MSVNPFDFFKDMGNYDERKVDRTEVNTLTVSSAYTSDEGYETAIIDAIGEVHPVERYATRDLCVVGHAKWVEFCKDSNNTTVVKLGGFGGLVSAKTITLTR